MTQYQGNVHSYVLDIQSPNNPYNHKSVITLHGTFGLALLYFVPQNGQLGENQKRAGQEIFDIYYWMDTCHISPTCCATRSRCISCTTILTTQLKSEAFPPPFPVGHCALPTVSSKPIFFHEKIAKTYLTRQALPCCLTRVRDQSQDRPRRSASTCLWVFSSAPTSSSNNDAGCCTV